MPELPNIRHESFCRLLAAGNTTAESYKLAGYKAKSARSASSCATKLLRNSLIKQRLAELRPAAQERIRATVSMDVDRSCMEVSGRVEALLERRAAILRVMADRAAFESRRVDANGNPREILPGVETGLVITSYKGIGGKAVRTHQIDIATLKLLNDIERQIAIECKQWHEKPGLTTEPDDDDCLRELAAAIRNSP